MTSKRLGVVAAGLLVLVSACQKQTQFSASDEAEIRGLFDSTAVWLKARNFDKWAAEFEDSGYMQPPNAKTLVGHAALLAWWAALPPIDELSFSNVQVAGDGNMAYGSSSYVLKPKDLPVDSGKQVVVFRRGADGHWKIPAGGFSSDLPLPAPPPTAQTKAPAAAKK